MPRDIEIERNFMHLAANSNRQSSCLYRIMSWVVSRGSQSPSLGERWRSLLEKAMMFGTRTWNPSLASAADVG
jgi:hypothetical protein